MKLSVSIISFNEEKNLPRTLEAIKDIADEIIIIDSFSNDKTPEIAKKYNAKFFQEEWKGFIHQKNSALEKCQNEWILCLDSDEVMTPELKQSILKVINSNSETNGYLINRKTYYLGKLLNYAWQPDWNLRLVKKSSNPRWKGLDIHDYLEVDGRTNKLNGYLIHYSYLDMKQHFDKTISYARISANSYFKKGKKFKLLNLIFNPIIAFIRLYFINKGIFDGVYGFIAASSSYIGTFLKYSFLWELELNNKNLERKNYE